ncbi:alpha/beta fold hydrolase [Flexibacterium corallicola]|uniref:alpha/beta fold hydrolase n=1 Tax=Flexibacterium corallicola TaxID=3037259 RepID=UPI00286EB4E6|nr:alpha/beta hydrolase [Pseudovibrio sp. M1P-2-3]
MSKKTITEQIKAVAPATPIEERWLSIPRASNMPQAAASGTLTINGIKMYHAIYGDAEGPPILLIHGGLAHADIWSEQVKNLMENYRVIVADSRGHGRTNNDGSVYTYPLLAKDYIALLDHLSIDKVHLVGWSDGACIGYIISQSNPERLASHFAHAGHIAHEGVDPSTLENPVFASYIDMMAADYAAMSPTPNGFENFSASLTAMWDTPKPVNAEGLKTVTVPTLVVQSKYEEAILLDHAKMIANLIPNSSFLTLPRVSHFALFQAPGEYAAAIRQFIEQ